MVRLVLHTQFKIFRDFYSKCLVLNNTVFVFKLKRVTLAPDPCTLLIGNVTFGLTSTDILFHMGAEEISR